MKNEEVSCALLKFNLMEESMPAKLDGFRWHEAFDRTFFCMEMFDRSLLFHPPIESVETLKAKAESAHKALFELYQEIGRVHLSQ